MNSLAYFLILYNIDTCTTMYPYKWGRIFIWIYTVLFIMNMIGHTFSLWWWPRGETFEILFSIFAFCLRISRRRRVLDVVAFRLHGSRFSVNMHSLTSLTEQLACLYSSALSSWSELFLGHVHLSWVSLKCGREDPSISPKSEVLSLTLK